MRKQRITGTFLMAPHVALDEDRATASVQTAHITMAYEIWDADG